MPRRTPEWDDQYLTLAQHLNYKALIVQRGLQPESARDFVQCMGEESAIESIDNTLMSVVVSHRLFAEDQETREDMDKCAREHMVSILRQLEYDKEEVAEGDTLPLPSFKNASNVLIKRFYALVLADYSLPKIERL